MKALVTGAGGQLGRDLHRALTERGHEVRALSHPELDVAQRDAVESALAADLPDVVLNCAAYTRVDDAEREPERAMQTNAEAAGLIARAAAACGAAVLYPSSDYVFDGRKGAPYVESDKTGPLSAYGRSKLAGEQDTAVANPRHYIVRSAWLFGMGGHNFVETMLRLAAGPGEVKVVDDQIGCPTYTGHLAAALAELVDTEAYGVHHIAGAGSCSWRQFAGEIFERAGVQRAVAPITTAQAGRPAPRPPEAVLVTEREDTPVLAPWRQGLAAYLAERAVAVS